ALEHQRLVKRDVPARGDVSQSHAQRGNAQGWRLQVIFELDVRMIFTKSFFPVVSQVALREIAGAPNENGAGNFLFWFVFWQVIEFPTFVVVSLFSARADALIAARLNIEATALFLGHNPSWNQHEKNKRGPDKVLMK